MHNRQSSATAVENNNNKDAAYGRYVFSNEEFLRIMSRYQNFTFEERIQNAIGCHSKQEGSKYFFYLYWNDSKNHLHPLKVTLMCDDEIRPGYSRFLPASRCNEFYKCQFSYTLLPQQKIYSLQVDLITNIKLDINEERLLMMWFTLDGVMGELSYVEAGTDFSGTEVLRIFRYFEEFLRIKHMVVCDNAKLSDPQSGGAIPLRLITAIAEDKTWIEKHIPGMRLMEGNIPVDRLVTLTQKSIYRNKCLNELQMLTISDWQKTMTTDQSDRLQMLFNNYFPPDKSSRQAISKLFSRKKENEKHCSMEKVTLQMLASAIFRESKELGKVSDNLIILNELLCGNIDVEFGNIPISKKSPDFWVKSRVYELLWGSYVWKQMSEMDLSQYKSDLTNTGSLKR